MWHISVFNFQEKLIESTESYIQKDTDDPNILKTIKWNPESDGIFSYEWGQILCSM